MRPVINLTKNQEEIIQTIFELYKKNSKYMTLLRGEEKYTIKYSFPEGIAVIDIDAMPRCYMFNVRAENSILLASRPVIPSLTVGLSLESGGHLKWHTTPKEKDSRQWLMQKTGSTSRAEQLVLLATAGEMIWSNFRFAFEIRPHSDSFELVPHKDFTNFATEGVRLFVVEYKKKHRTDGWDVINLTQNQLMKLGETLEDHHIKHDFENISIRKFCLSLFQRGKKEDFFQYYFFTYTSGNLHVDVEEDHAEGKVYCDIACKLLEDGQLELELSDKTNGMEWLTKTDDSENVAYWQWLVDVFFSINSFMLHFGDVTMEVEEKIAKEPSEHKEHKKQDRKNTVRIFKSYTLKKNWKSQARKKAEITCPAWGVRGHFRHLRNGKVIFVEPYIKGPEKSKYKGKEYALLPYREA